MPETSSQFRPEQRSTGTGIMAVSWVCAALVLATCVSAQSPAMAPGPASATLGISPLNSTTISTNFIAPVTVGLLDGMRTNSTSLDLNDPSLPGANAGPNDPTEVHIVPAGPNAMYISWATGNYTVGQGALTPKDPTKSSSVVKYGTTPTNLSLSANGSVEVYSQIYNTTGASVKGGSTAVNYTSPYLHTAVLSNLTAATTYYYQVGDGTTFSATYNFTALQQPGPNYPQRIIAIADWGASHNSTVTLTHAVESAYAAGVGVAPVVHYIGDFCYADTWYANGTASLPTSGFEGRASSTYQPVWDLWQRMIEPLVSHVPMMTATGNHEIEQQDDANNTVFASVQARWKTPATASKSPQYFFYSQEYGPVHSIFLTVYTDYTPGSPQWNWLSLDLLSVDRTKTPWITVNFHNPWYTTDPSYKEFEQMRVSMEPLFQQAGVDVVFYGHVHAYERSYPVYNYMLDPCGTNHITIGDAGNTEGLSFLTYDGTRKLYLEDVNGGCPNVTTTRPAYMYSVNPTVTDPFYYYQRTLTFQGNGNTTGLASNNYPQGYCYNAQPAWSAYREPSFGHGTLDVLNSTHALWSWHRNQDNNKVAADQAYIIRDPVKCLNKMYPQMRSTNGAMMVASS